MNIMLLIVFTSILKIYLKKAKKKYMLYFIVCGEKKYIIFDCFWLGERRAFLPTAWLAARPLHVSAFRLLRCLQLLDMHPRRLEVHPRRLDVHPRRLDVLVFGLQVLAEFHHNWELDLKKLKLFSFNIFNYFFLWYLFVYEKISFFSINQTRN